MASKPRTLCAALLLLLVLCPAAWAQSASPPATDIQTLDEPIFRFVVDASLTIGAVDTLEDMWQVGGIIDLDLADGVIEVVSSSPLDTLLGTGAQRLVLRGNTSDAFPEFQSVEIDMDGTTPVETTETFQGFSLAQARVIQSDDLQRRDLPTGTITITQSGTVVGIIGPGSLQTRHGFRRIPYGPDGQIQTWDIFAGNISIRDLGVKADANATATLWTLSPGDQAHTDGAVTIHAATDSSIALPFLETYESGETFALRLECDQDTVVFFANIFARVTVKRTGPVLIVRELD